MTPELDKGRAQWRTFTSYVLVTTGAVVGLGNIFGFPFLMIQYGALFLLFYLLCEIAIAIPLLLAELLIGRRGRQNPVGSLSIMSMECDASLNWRKIGWLCFLILILTLPLYIASVAFPVDNFFYFLNKITSQYNLHLPFNKFDTFLELESCFIIFLIATFLVIVRGINKGLEIISCIIVPLYIFILTVLAIYIGLQEGFLPGIYDLITSHANQSMLVIFSAALLYAFFKLNVGMGTMIVYGSYLPYSVSLVKSTFVVICLDALVSLASYFIIYPLMIKSHLAQVSSESVDLIFLALSNRDVISLFFFFGAVLAAWLPSIAMAEAATVTLIERFYLSRYISALVVSVIILLIGSLVILSKTWTGIFTIRTISLAYIIDTISSTILTPISALLIALFIGWVVTKDVTRSELEFNPIWYSIWLYAIRYLAPIAILAVMFFKFM